MISIEAYRISIGNFNGTRQFDLRSIYRHLILNSSISSRSMSRILKPLPFLAIILYASIMLILSGDIESNPGPVTIFKVVKASSHQGNATIFGRTAGSQCTFMSLSAIVYSNVKSLRYWSQNDLDTILNLCHVPWKVFHLNLFKDHTCCCSVLIFIWVFLPTGGK